MGASADRPANQVHQFGGPRESSRFAARIRHLHVHPGDRAAQEAIVLKSFPGDSGLGPKDNPDNTGGVGPSHVVDCTDANIVIHDKITGNVLQRMTQTEFWKNAQPGFTLPTLNDPRMTYDPLAGAVWFTVVQAQGGTPFGFLAVSASMDPTGPWNGVRLPMAPANLGMKLGFDRTGLHHVHRDDRRHAYHARLSGDSQGRWHCRPWAGSGERTVIFQIGDRILPRDGH